MKHCSRCGVCKPLDDFTIDKRKLDGRSARCRPCHNEVTRTARRGNQAYLDDLAARRAERRARLSAIKLERGCIDCGYRAHPDALEFDHRPGTAKAFDVAAGPARASWSAIEREMEKCDVVCANCHRIRTAERRGARVA